MFVRRVFSILFNFEGPGPCTWCMVLDFKMQMMDERISSQKLVISSQLRKWKAKRPQGSQAKAGTTDNRQLKTDNCPLGV